MDLCVERFSKRKETLFDQQADLFDKAMMQVEELDVTPVKAPADKEKNSDPKKT